MNLKNLDTFFRYDHKTGKVFWKYKKFSKDKLGKEIGYNNRQKNKNYVYRRVQFMRKFLYVHHIVWYFNHGYLPRYIDHIDGNGLNNHISNLRETDHSGNMQNLKVHRDGHLAGTFYLKNKNRKKRWIAQVKYRKNGVPSNFRIGYFYTKEEAHLAFLFYKEWEMSK